jgi:plasmid maintenance system antidote protein VapI
MAKIFNDDEVVKMIRKAVHDAGTQAKLADAWGVSAPFISDVLNKRRNISDAIARNLGLVQVWTKAGDA